MVYGLPKEQVSACCLGLKRLVLLSVFVLLGPIDVLFASPRCEYVFFSRPNTSFSSPRLDTMDGQEIESYDDEAMKHVSSLAWLPLLKPRYVKISNINYSYLRFPIKAFMRWFRYHSDDPEAIQLEAQIRAVVDEALVIQNSVMSHRNAVSRNDILQYTSEINSTYKSIETVVVLLRTEGFSKPVIKDGNLIGTVTYPGVPAITVAHSPTEIRRAIQLGAVAVAALTNPTDGEDIRRRMIEDVDDMDLRQRISTSYSELTTMVGGVLPYMKAFYYPFALLDQLKQSKRPPREEDSYFRQRNYHYDGSAVPDYSARFGEDFKMAEAGRHWAHDVENTERTNNRLGNFVFGLMLSMARQRGYHVVHGFVGEAQANYQSRHNFNSNIVAGFPVTEDLKEIHRDSSRWVIEDTPQEEDFLMRLYLMEGSLFADTPEQRVAHYIDALNAYDWSDENQQALYKALHRAQKDLGRTEP